jgi:glucose-1-phosphatase
MAETKESFEKTVMFNRNPGSARKVIKVIIFDFGGVLMKNESLSLWQKRFASLGAKVEISLENGPSADKIAQYCTGKYSSDEAFLKELREILQIPLEVTDKQVIAAWNAQVMELNLDLYKVVEYGTRFQLFGLSNTNKMHSDFFEYVLYPAYARDHNDKNLPTKFRELFKTVYTSNEIFCKKPDPMAWKRILNDNPDFAPEECLFVDDVETYTNAAKRLGMHTFCFNMKKHCLDNIIQYIDAFNATVPTSSHATSLAAMNMKEETMTKRCCFFGY